MKTIGVAILGGVMALSAVSCGKITMPKMEMPKLLQGEEPRAKFRQQVAKVLKANDDPAAYHREMADLLDLSAKLGWDNHRMLAEVVAYCQTIDNNDQLPAYFRLLETLRVPRTTIVDVMGAQTRQQPVAPRSVGDALLRWAAPPEARGRVDYSHFHQYLEVHQAQPPAGLVQWMYRHDPSAALWEMMSIYGGQISAEQRQTIILAEHLVAEILWRQEQKLADGDQFAAAATQQLSNLSQSPYWWVRLYAAQMIGRHPKLGSDEVVKRLGEDDNALVAEAIGK